MAECSSAISVASLRPFRCGKGVDTTIRLLAEGRIDPGHEERLVRQIVTLVKGFLHHVLSSRTTIVVLNTSEQDPSEQNEDMSCRDYFLNRAPALARLMELSTGDIHRWMVQTRKMTDDSPVCKLSHELDFKECNLPFPVKLHHLLSEAQHNGWDRFISWDPHGRSFKIHNPTAFIRYILPVFFGNGNASWFESQLNEFGFVLLIHGNDKDCIYHKHFVRGNEQLAHFVGPAMATASTDRRVVPRRKKRRLRKPAECPIQRQVVLSSRMLMPNVLDYEYVPIFYHCHMSALDSDVDTLFFGSNAVNEDIALVLERFGIAVQTIDQY